MPYPFAPKTCIGSVLGTPLRDVRPLVCHVAVRLQVLFCGHTMRAGYQFTHEAVQRSGLAAMLQVSECSWKDLPHAIRDVHVAVPLMARFDAPLLQSAQQLRLLLQFGVGIEGIDIAEARTDTHPSCSDADASATTCVG